MTLGKGLINNHRKLARVILVRYSNGVSKLVSIDIFVINSLNG